MGLADLHLHTIYSYDGTASLAAVLNRAKQLGLDVIAITDHDEIAGALKAMKLASNYGVEVIPGSEITTADGDLLAFFITEKVPAGLSLIETVLRVRELGGVCVAPHPMAGGMGMKSLSARTILEALRNPLVAETLIGIETYNGTSIDRISNHSANLLASSLNIAKTGSSDAHVIDTIGFGTTEFEGNTAADLLMALKNKTTKARRQNEWSAFRIIGSWGMRYMESAFVRLTGLAWA
ncbi:MAG: PHP domain-containing protein [Anaerolineales bacterium]|uniref:PHP domain-containing protein n=1 Tax=Candidatus Villigracilis proximus TaxID=3140683 RepID=UPI003135EED2|nr:PHP domain-containing protein [Anaerolineales bacterium]